jgi:hypothetical protein
LSDARNEKLDDKLVELRNKVESLLLDETDGDQILMSHYEELVGTVLCNLVATHLGDQCLACRERWKEQLDLRLSQEHYRWGIFDSCHHEDDGENNDEASIHPISRNAGP